jgi:hypothetical protein
MSLIDLYAAEFKGLGLRDAACGHQFNFSWVSRRHLRADRIIAGWIRRHDADLWTA